MSRTLRNTLITICGLIALLTPLFLWMAWSTDVFYVILGIGCAAIAAVYLLVSTGRRETF